MKDIFMCLLLNLAQHGKIVEANMYKGGTYSNITIKTENDIFKISVMKEEDEEEKTTDGNIRD